MRLLLQPACLAIFLTPAALCQSATPATLPAPPPQPSPKAAYDSAMHPLETTRQSFSNWSDTEIAALKVTVARAAVECKARKPETFQGSALIDLARLCALGQIWSATIGSAKLYIDHSHAPDPLLSQAYNLLVDAQLHARDQHGAFASTQSMLATVPYDAISRRRPVAALSAHSGSVSLPDLQKAIAARQAIHPLTPAVQ